MATTDHLGRSKKDISPKIVAFLWCPIKLEKATLKTTQFPVDMSKPVHLEAG